MRTLAHSRPSTRRWRLPYRRASGRSGGLMASLSSPGRGFGGSPGKHAGACSGAGWRGVGAAPRYRLRFASGGAYIAPLPMAREKDSFGRSDEHNSRGIELADRGWLDEAVKEFKRAIELDPESAHAYDNLATVYAEKKLFREALEAYLTALRLEPDSPTAHYNLGCFLSMSGGEMAIAAFKEAIELDPEYPDAHVYLGLTYADQGQVEDALRELQVAVSMDGEDAFARHELASLLMDEGQFRQAISHLREVVKLEEENFDA